MEAYGNEAADKLAARGALRYALSIEYVAAIRNTDRRVRLVQTRLIEINLVHVQNRTKTVRVKVKAAERRTKFDPDEAMCQLNRIGHDFCRVQVGKGRFTYKCRLCFLRGERAFLKQLLGKPCSAVSRSAVPLLVPVSVSTPDEPESFFIGDTPSSEDDPFGWGGDFDQDHRVMSDQDLPLSPVRPMKSAEMDPCLSSGHTMEDAEFADCVSGTPDVLCSAAEQAKKFQGYVVADDMSASPRRGEECEHFGLTTVHLWHQFGFRDATLWCWWKCGGWSAGSRRASRLKNPCGFPSKTGADVVHRVSGGYPVKAHVWRSDDVSGAPERIRSSRIPTTRGTDHKSSSKTIAPRELGCLFANLLSSAKQGMA